MFLVVQCSKDRKRSRFSCFSVAVEEDGSDCDTLQSSSSLLEVLEGKQMDSTDAKSR